MADVVVYTTSYCPYCTAAKGLLDDDGFLRLRRGALELVERLGSHIQKETMSLLPALDDILDGNSAAELTMAYASA